MFVFPGIFFRTVGKALEALRTEKEAPPADEDARHRAWQALGELDWLATRSRWECAGAWFRSGVLAASTPSAEIQVLGLRVHQRAPRPALRGAALRRPGRAPGMSRFADQYFTRF